MTIRLVYSNDPALRELREAEFNQAVGAVLQGWARESGVSDAKMAEHLEIGTTMLWRHYTGRTALTCLRAARMCRVLGHDLGELFG